MGLAASKISIRVLESIVNECEISYRTFIGNVFNIATQIHYLHQIKLHFDRIETKCGGF
jgi:hypothetical protein